MLLLNLQGHQKYNNNNNNNKQTFEYAQITDSYCQNKGAINESSSHGLFRIFKNNINATVLLSFWTDNKKILR